MDDLRREVSKNLGEAGYAAVGFAVLGFQKAQVRRRQLVDLLGREVRRISSWLEPPAATEEPGGAGTEAVAGTEAAGGKGEGEGGEGGGEVERRRSA